MSFSLELNEDQLAIQQWIHDFSEGVIRPVAAEWDEREETPWPVIEEAAKIGLYSFDFFANAFGDDTGLTIPVAMEELFWGDAGIGLSIVGTVLGVAGIMANGTPEQIGEWVPQCFGTPDKLMMSAFCVSEPDAGSDVSSLRTTAVYDEAKDEWVLNGQKTWITNGGIADVAVVWARTDEGIRGFVVPTDTPGFSTNDVHRKLSLRASVTSELVLDDVRLPADAVLPGVASMRGPLSCLNEARFGILFGAVGAARACYEAALDYAAERTQFGQPIAGFQLTQRKLVELMVAVNRTGLVALHLGRRKDAHELTPAQVSFGKFDNVRTALEVAREARSILGANGITLEYPVIRHMNNLESVFTYEGTNEIHTLVLGQAITGLPAFR